MMCIRDRVYPFQAFSLCCLCGQAPNHSFFPSEDVYKRQDGPLMAGGGTQAAAVAFFFVNVDDPSFHVIFLPVHLPAGARGCTRTAFAAVSIPRPQETVCCFYNEIHIFADTDKKRSVHRAQPVSYTHLDVYKRQEQARHIRIRSWHTEEWT